MAGDRHGEAVVLLRPSKHDVQILRCAQDDRLGHTRIVVILNAAKDLFISFRRDKGSFVQCLAALRLFLIPNP